MKICANGITKSFTRLVNLLLPYGSFSKLANDIPIFKKDDRQLKKDDRQLNYRPVSLLVPLSKIAERLYFSTVNFLLGIKLLKPLQSGFRPGYSTINQLAYVVHKIYDALERGKEVRMVFLDISKAFDNVCNRKQRVVIEGQSSEWKNINSGVPQGSVLGPLLFLTYINDITENLETDCFCYADDTSLYDAVDTPAMTSIKLNNDLKKLKSRLNDDLLQLIQLRLNL